MGLKPKKVVAFSTNFIPITRLSRPFVVTRSQPVRFIVSIPLHESTRQNIDSSEIFTNPDRFTACRPLQPKATVFIDLSVIWAHRDRFKVTSCDRFLPIAETVLLVIPKHPLRFSSWIFLQLVQISTIDLSVIDDRFSRLRNLRRRQPWDSAIRPRSSMFEQSDRSSVRSWDSARPARDPFPPIHCTTSFDTEMQRWR